MTYSISWMPRAIKDLEKLGRTAEEQVRKKMELVKEDPNRYIDLFVTHGILKARAGDYRILLRLFHDTKLIEVIAVDHRSNAYKP